MEIEIFKLHNNKENKAIYIIINYTSNYFDYNTNLYDLPKNILANFNINIIMSKSMPIFFIIIEDKTDIIDLLIFNIKKFCYIRKYLYFQDINVYNYNYNCDIIRNILFIKQQKGMIINYNDINKNKFKMKRNINKFIYDCLYFNYKIGDRLFLLKIKKFDSFNTEKKNDENKKIILLENKNDKKMMIQKMRLIMK